MSSQAAGQPQAAAGGPSRGPGLTFAATRCVGRRRQALRPNRGGGVSGGVTAGEPRCVAAALPTHMSRACTPLCVLRLEEVYLVYTAEKNRGLTLRLHFMLVAAWAVGALKTLSQLLLAVQQ